VSKLINGHERAKVHCTDTAGNAVDTFARDRGAMDQTDITDIGRRAAAPRRIALVAHDSGRGRRHPRGGEPPPNQQPAPELDDTTLSAWHQIIGHGDMTEKAKLALQSGSSIVGQTIASDPSKVSPHSVSSPIPDNGGASCAPNRHRAHPVSGAG